MIQTLKKNANSLVLVGVFVLFIYSLGMEIGVGLPIIVQLIGLLVVLLGCVYYAKSKGYSNLTGILFGLFGVFGWLFIYLSPDKTMESTSNIPSSQK